jgi:hypothetical protein
MSKKQMNKKQILSREVFADLVKSYAIDADRDSTDPGLIRKVRDHMMNNWEKYVGMSYDSFISSVISDIYKADLMEYNPHPEEPEAIGAGLPEHERAIVRFLDEENINRLFNTAKNFHFTKDHLMVKTQIVSLDTINRSPYRQEFAWKILHGDWLGQENSVKILEMPPIVRISVMPFWMPIPDDIHLYNKLITMDVNEFSLNGPAIAVYNNGIGDEVKYQFAFDIKKIDKNAGKMYLVPQDDYSPPYPIVNINSISITFNDPYNRININDRGIYNTEIINGWVSFVGDANEIQVGDVVYLQNYESPNKKLNELICSPMGHRVCYVRENCFSINVPGEPSESSVVVVFGKKRMLIRIKLYCLNTADFVL